jgi:hypothetical protein
MVPFVLGGMGVWALLGVIFWVAGAPADWIRICVAAFVIAIPGLGLMIVHDRNRRARRAREAAAAEAQTDSTAASS